MVFFLLVVEVLVFLFLSRLFLSRLFPFLLFVVLLKEETFYWGVKFVESDLEIVSEIVSETSSSLLILARKKKSISFSLVSFLFSLSGPPESLHSSPPSPSPHKKTTSQEQKQARKPAENPNSLKTGEKGEKRKRKIEQRNRKGVFSKI